MNKSNVEIERKFLVKGDWPKDIRTSEYTVQGYLTSSENCTVRVRVMGGRGFITIKGKTDGISRSEFEYEIPVVDAKAMMDQLCADYSVEKIRYTTQYKGMTWEIDEFLGDNKGLVVAEVELESVDQEIELPPWVGKEVSDDPKYFNALLVKVPYKNWD